MKRGMVILAMGFLALTAEAVEGQRCGHDHDRNDGPGGSFGIALLGARAVGDLGTRVDQGLGLHLAGGFPMTADGQLRLRLDGGFVVYGVERLSYCGFTCRVSSDITTTNNILYAGVGPELVLARGDVRPYVYGTAGISYFLTHSWLDDNDGYGPYLQTTNFSDAVYGLRYGGGVRIRVGGHRKPVFIDLGLERHDNGVAEYLTRGDIVDNPDGRVTLYPNRSDADLMSFRFGISIGG